MAATASNDFKKAPLPPTTSEFAHLEYGLQLALNSSTARIISAYVVSHPKLSTQFEKRCKDILVQNSWIEPSQLIGANTEDEVIRRGFQFAAPSQGIKLSVGVIKSNQAGGHSGSVHGTESPQVKKILLCKVGIGRAQVTDEISAEREVVPEGYDSFYVLNRSRGANGHAMGHDGKSGYHHEYVIKSTAQILPMYLVHYEFDSVKELKSREKPKCDNCEAEAATIYCSSDAANLCNKCDMQLHTSKFANRHIRTPIGKGADVFGHCRHHPDKKIEFFCSQCHIPVCVYCKMVGNHANGESAKHQLVSVTEAYQTVLQEARTLDPVLQSRRTEIINQIGAVNQRAKAVSQMGAQIETQIEDMYKRAMAELHNVINDKINVLLGDELELKRQLGEIEHLEEYVKYQQQGDATQFLFSWARHQAYRSELHDFKFFRNSIDVELDVKVNGGINIVLDDGVGGGTSSNGASGTGAGGAGGVGSVGKGGTLKKVKTLGGVGASQMLGGMNVNAGMVGMGLPKKIQERRIQRRTSDFFAESLAMTPNMGWSNECDDQSVFSDRD
ncbi:hypothetical protein BC830DRAFT_1166058 [Chytriomyces sp. MP71]|nr:hypothetical protein BC830DRAFT_1166058 [Chytriomyces sp. MP71]